MHVNKLAIGELLHNYSESRWLGVLPRRGELVNEHLGHFDPILVARTKIVSESACSQKLVELSDGQYCILDEASLLIIKQMAGCIEDLTFPQQPISVPLNLGVDIPKEFT